MEKFAVDLDKVLDDFEFNEDRAEQLASIPPKKLAPPPSSNQNRPVAPPYRRPQFEAINMAEADYAAAPEQSYHSHWRNNSPSAVVTAPSLSSQPISSDVGLTWGEKNALLSSDDDDEEEDEEDEIDSENERGGRPYDVPKNVNENVGYYKNNSFRDEYLDRGNVNTSDEDMPDSKWSSDRLKFDGVATNKVKVKGGATFLGFSREHAATGRDSKARDVKTVSNNLSATTSDKMKNVERTERAHADDERNLPDVASTSERPTVSNSADNNNTFDLVTDLRRLQPDADRYKPASAAAVSSDDTSEEELGYESAETDAAITLPTTAAGNPTTSTGLDAEATNNNVTGAGATVDVSQKPKRVELQSLFSFTAMDHLSDSDLLSYLQEIEDEESEKEKLSTLHGDVRTSRASAAPSSGSASLPSATRPDPAPDQVSAAVDGSGSLAKTTDEQDLDELIPVVDLEKDAIFERQVEFIPAISPSAVRRETPSERGLTEVAVDSTDNLEAEPSDDWLEPEAMTKAIVCEGGVNENGSRLVPATSSLDSNLDVASIPIGRTAMLVAPTESAIGRGTSSVTVVADGNALEGFAGVVVGQHSPSESLAVCKDVTASEAVIGQNTDGMDITSALIGRLVPLERIQGRDATMQNVGLDGAAANLSVRANTSTVGLTEAVIIDGSVVANGAAIGAVDRKVVKSSAPIGAMDGEVAASSAVIGPSREAVAANSAAIGLPQEAVATNSSVIGPRESVFEMSLPESQRQSETEDSSPEDEESMEDCGGGGGGAFEGISAETGDVIQLREDADRPGYAVDEVRTPMIQSPRDGSTIHVLGEEERPTRPKYLLLSSVASADHDQSSHHANTGPPGSTPSTATANQNVRSHVLDNITSTNTASVANVNVTADINMNVTEATDNAADDNAADDNAADDNAANDNAANINAALASEQELAVGCAETLAPDPGSLDVLTPEERCLGKLPPFWIPDQEAPTCMGCEARFTVLKRRHHCRACGKVLCSKCCALKFRLEYMQSTEGRVCPPCYHILLKVLLEEQGENAGGDSPSHGGGAGTPLGRQPNPNNPMEYCSTIPPLQQQASGGGNPPSVLVPVLKREGSARPKGEAAKQVMFSDGIRPGGDLTELDGSAEPRLPFRRPGRVAKRVATPPGGAPSGPPSTPLRTSLPPLDPKTHSYIRAEGGLPPVATTDKGELTLDDSMSNEQMMTSLRSKTEPPLSFAINRNLFVKVKILNLTCCVSRVCWCFSTQGLSSVGQDEVMFVLEATEHEACPPPDVFTFVNTLYQDAVRGSSVSEMGCTLLSTPFLGSSQHGAVLYIRRSFQCLNQLIVPSAPYLVVLLVHRSEVPWARVFPIRLMLRLGAELRYYPCSLVSIRDRPPVYREVGHTIMNLLADLRNLTYTLPAVRGLVVHMEDRQTSVLLPRNRYDQVTRAINNSNEHVLALAANLSLVADSHLVCVQSEADDSYHTQAINIHNKPRRVTGASYVVFNGALKTSSNLTAKSSIVEDGLMVQITPDTMLALRAALRNMKDFSVGCGPAGADPPDETVAVKWVDDDKLFNVGVQSVIDGRSLDGVPSIRVHNGTDYMGRTRLVRWTEVFILQSEEGGSRTQDPVDVGRLSESIARATCQALVKLLDLLAQAGYAKLAVRATIHPDNVGYEVGSCGEKLPPIYMNSLDNELVPVLHTAAAANDHADAVLELVFHVLLQ